MNPNQTIRNPYQKEQIKVLKKVLGKTVDQVTHYEDHFVVRREMLDHRIGSSEVFATEVKSRLAKAGIEIEIKCYGTQPNMRSGGSTVIDCPHRWFQFDVI